MEQFILFVLFNILVISISTLNASSIQEPYPFFAWSSSNHIVGNHIYSYENYESSDITSILLSTVKDSQITSEFINKESQPEVIVIYYGSSDLRGEINSFKRSFEHSQSSLLLPYSYSDDSVTSIQNLAQYASRVLIVGESKISLENSESMELKSVLEEISSGSLTNGKVDIIIVDITNEPIESIRGTIAKLESLLKNENSISFLLSQSKELDISFHSRKIFLPMKEYGEQPPYSSRWPAYVIEGLLTSSLLVFFLLISVIYTCCVQTPDQFEVKKVAHFVS